MKITRQSFLYLALCLLVLGIGSPIFASTSATITGRVTDQQGLVVPGAQVQATNILTNINYAGETNEDGLYRIPNLPPGEYRVIVQRDGFASIAKPGVELHVQDIVTLNFFMQVGSVTQTITVEAGATLINTESAAVSTVVDRQFAENLPMNGRSFQTLIQLTPGVVLVPSNSGDSGQFTVNGQRAASNYWMVDGVSANIGVTSGSFVGNGFGGTLGSFTAQGGTNSLVSVDALQEFRIQTSTYAPEFGRTPGGQISIVTRSGTNQFHGTLFNYLRNDVLDANNWFSNAFGLRKAPERQNDFGGVFAGPILKNRTFFFFSYEGLRLRLPQTALSNVPCDSTCQVFGNARGMAVSAMQPFFNVYPLPNGPEVFTPCTPNVGGCPASGQRPTGSAQFNASYSNSSTLDAYSIRGDHKLSDKLALFGRYNFSPSESVQRGPGSLALSVLRPSRITVQTATVGATWAFSSLTTNDFRFNYSRTNARSFSFLDNFGGAIPLTSLPFPSPFTAVNGTLVFRISSLGVRRDLSVGAAAENLQRQINIVDNLSLQRGSHAMKFGVDFRRLTPMANPALYAQLVIFGNVASAANGSSSFAQIGSRAAATVLIHNLGVFGQDTWRATPRLTMTYGLRWDLEFAPSSIDGPSIVAVTGFNLNDFSQLAIAPAGTPPYSTTYGNVAPRVGLAYQISRNQEWGTVVRGGFGVFYDLVGSAVGTSVVQRPPFGAVKNVAGPTFPLNAAQSAPPPIPSTGVISQLYAFNPQFELPYTLEWNVALEQALGKQQTLTASYVGAQGKRLIQTAAVFGPPTNPSVSGQFVDDTAGSDYHALQLQFQRRLSHGLQVLASYAWSHSIDTASAGSPSVFSNAGLPGNPDANRGPSDFDIRHAFSAGLTYEIPVPKMSALSDAILRGWSLQSVIQARSAPPVGVSDVAFFSLGNGVFADIRPDVVPGQPFYLSGPQFPGGKAFNPAAFTDPPTTPVGCNPFVNRPCDPARQGNLGRNVLRGFGATQWDFAVHRTFAIRESLKLQFRAEMFNVLNHPNFGPPSGAFLSPQNGGPAGFGVATSMLGQYLNGGTVGSNIGGGAFDPLYQLGGPRSIQFGLKLQF